MQFTGVRTGEFHRLCEDLTWVCAAVLGRVGASGEPCGASPAVGGEGRELTHHKSDLKTSSGGVNGRCTVLNPL